MRKLLGSVLAVGLAVSASLPARAQKPAPRPSVDASALLIPKADRATEKYTVRRGGEVDVIVRLSDQSLAAYSGVGHKQARIAGDTAINREQQIAHVRRLSANQDAFTALASSLGAKEIARFQRSINAVALRVKPAQLKALRGLPGVVSVKPVVHYERDLAETVPYIGAKAVQDSGNTGTGVRVAVLDSGVDYTHKNMGGAGTLEAFALAYGDATTDTKNTTRDGLFPTAKVVEGFDFVGETWGFVNGEEVGERTEDPDPIDFEGHGTSVADIIAGASTDGTHKGVAPGASIVAVKVCSAISSSCNGVAIIKGIEYSIDPNGDGDTSDAVDVMNLSLGLSYGQVEDDASFALGQASQLGVLVVASAGNSADRPFIAGSPSTQSEVLSVAQTTVPSAVTFPLVVTIDGVERSIRNTNSMPWAPLGAGFSGAITYIGRGCYGVATDPTSAAAADDAYLSNPSGKIALIDRGACSVSAKIDRAAKAGATAVLIVNNAAGDPPSFSQGFGTAIIPALVLTQADGTSLKTALTAGKAVTGAVSSAVSISLRGSMVASSSRGPSFSHTLIKPEIGAPGASIAAVAGSGAEEAPFGGTSGAAPMVSGSAALVLAARPSLTPRDVKSLLVNTADDNIQTNAVTAPGVLAPITRIGGGEVRANKAVAAQTAIWASDNQNPALSFGYHSITADKTLRKRIVVRNYSDKRRTYTITPKFRYADDAASGAVTPVVPASITVGANSSKSFVLELKINAAKLPEWGLNGGSLGGAGSLLQTVEFDGYLEVSEGGETVHAPWHVLPHRSAAPRAASRRVRIGTDGTGSTTINNTGVQTASVDAFALTGVSPKVDEDLLPNPGDNFAVADLKAVGVRPVAFDAETFGVQFAIATNGKTAHPMYPHQYQVIIDSNRDGEFDYIVLQRELNGFATTGQCVVSVIDLAAQTIGNVAFCDADFHSGNLIMTVGLEDIGLTGLDNVFSFYVEAVDTYYRDNVTTDAISNWMTAELLKPKYYGELSTADSTVAPGGSATLTVFSSDTQYLNVMPNGDGVLLMYRDAAENRESEIIRAR
jgi:minor extracellular serine protease Vpr